MSISKTSKIAVLAITSLLVTIASASAHGNHHHKVNYYRDYTAIVIYTAPEPIVHRAVKRKVIAAQRRQARTTRRFIRATLR